MTRRSIARQSRQEVHGKKKVKLTAKGTRLVAKLAPIWAAFDEVARELNMESGDVVALLDKLDDALARQSTFNRMMVLVARRGGLV